MTIAEAESVVNDFIPVLIQRQGLYGAQWLILILRNVVRTMVVVTGVKSPQILGKNTAGNIATARNMGLIL